MSLPLSLQFLLCALCVSALILRRFSSPPVADGRAPLADVGCAVRGIAIHVGLFLAACVTTWMHGGPYFAATLMGILVCHEFGHYFVGRHHGVEVSLPYFIPLPPQISLGT